MLPQTELCLFGFFTSSSVTRLNLARVPRLTSDNCTCCHTDSERGDHDFCLSRSHYGRVSTKTETTRPETTRTVYSRFVSVLCFHLPNSKPETKRGMARWVFPRGGKSEKGPVVRKINLIFKKF